MSIPELSLYVDPEIIFNMNFPSTQRTQPIKHKRQNNICRWFINDGFITETRDFFFRLATLKTFCTPIYRATPYPLIIWFLRIFGERKINLKSNKKNEKNTTRIKVTERKLSFLFCLFFLLIPEKIQWREKKDEEKRLLCRAIIHLFYDFTDLSLFFFYTSRTFSRNCIHKRKMNTEKKRHEKDEEKLQKYIYFLCI